MAVSRSTASARRHPAAAAPPPRVFTAAQHEALFAAILIDDEIDPHTALPAAIRLDYAPRELGDCFGLAYALWAAGFDRDFLIRAAAALRRSGDLGPDDRRAFKHVRAKFKHLRYAHVLYGTRTAYPPLLDRITITMGHLQDAYRHHRRGAALLHAALLRLWLTRPFVARLRREAATLEPIGAGEFRARLERDTAALARVAAADRITGDELHAARKIIGRQVSFYDTLRTLEPAPDSVRMSRSLSAINGLMGALHDDLVLARSRDRRAYHARFALPEPIRLRLAALVARLSTAGEVTPPAA